MNRFTNWQKPKFDKDGKTKWNWICQYFENLTLGKNSDIGAFTYINAKFGVSIAENVQIGSHCSIYSENTIDNTKGGVKIGKNAKIGTHSTIFPGVTIGENAVIGAYSLIKSNVLANTIVWGIPAKIRK